MPFLQIEPKFVEKTRKMVSINQNAPVKCSKSIQIQATPEKVWAILTDIDNWANWQTTISKAKLNGVLKPDTTFAWKTGGVKIYSTLHTVKPYEMLGWTGKTIGTYAIHNWFTKSTNGSTEVSVEESLEGWVPRLFKHSFGKDLEKGMLLWLQLLKTTCEKA